MKFDHAAASLRHVCKHKEVVTATGLSHVRILQMADLTAAGILNIILMTDWNLERIMCL